MAEDDTDRQDELDAERSAEIEDELERIDRDPDEVDDGDGSLGGQNAPRNEEQPQDLPEAEEADEETEGEVTSESDVPEGA